MIFKTNANTQSAWVEKIKLSKFLLFVFFFSSFFVCCNNQPSGTDSEVKDADTAAVSNNPNKQRQNDSIKIVVTAFLENDQWGYDIILNDKLYIHQPNIPSVPGNDGFKTKEDAIRTGEFVAYKIRNNILPPTVTPEQLDSLGVIEKK